MFVFCFLQVRDVNEVGFQGDVPETIYVVRQMVK